MGLYCPEKLTTHAEKLLKIVISVKLMLHTFIKQPQLFSSEKHILSKAVSSDMAPNLFITFSCP
jgi:hypothetical protein